MLLLPSQAKATEGESVPSVTMCDLAREPQKYSGKNLRLKAEYGASLHGSSFFDKACPTVVLGGRTWSNTACPGGADAANAKVDLEVLRWVEELYVRRVAAGKVPTVEVVVVGELLLPAEGSKAVQLAGGRTGGAGFCHMGSSPFQVMVRKVESVTFREPSGDALTNPN
ncbi:MAG: hypothetical protein J0H49_12510 [Acidobacteria bacterium]|nr:hypothetical protein [Acidobacteriota bacterium]